MVPALRPLVNGGSVDEREVYDGSEVKEQVAEYR